MRESGEPVDDDGGSGGANKTNQVAVVTAQPGQTVEVNPGGKVNVLE